MNDEILKKARKLKEKLDYHNKKYYENDDPEVEDWEYDSLKREFEGLRRSFPELLLLPEFRDSVGGKASIKFSPVRHKVRMESLHDSFSIEEIKKFYEKVSGEDSKKFVVEPKVDGISLSVEYLNGHLVRASTRGDGDVGEDVTENAMTIQNLPHEIDANVSYLEIRGECFMSKSDFKELTKLQEEENERVFKNPRNASAGSIRQKDSNKCARRNLKILFFNVQQIKGKSFESHSQSLNFLKGLGLPVIDFKECADLGDIVNQIKKIGRLRKDFEFQSDGAVVKVDSIEDRKILGSTSSFPRWAEAFKYPPEVKKTLCTDIEFSIGRTGIITPVCVFDPINLGGSVVSRASLHNEEFAKKKNVNVGDFVYIMKAGDIIPEVFKTEVNQDKLRTSKFEMPEICPSCEQKLSVEESEVGRIFRCRNDNCFCKIRSKIMHFVSRDAMNIENFGEETFNIMKNIMKNCSDVYKINENILNNYEEFRNKRSSAMQEMIFGFDQNICVNKLGKNLIKSINKSKNNSLERLIYGIGIPFVGREISKILAIHFKNLDNLINCSFEELLNIRGIGEKIADSIFNFFRDNNNIKIIDNLKKYGLNIKYIQSKSDKFIGISFAITGKFDKYSRKELEHLLENFGGNVNSYVSSKTSYLVCGKDPGRKLEDAKSLNVKIIFEKDLNNFIN